MIKQGQGRPRQHERQRCRHTGQQHRLAQKLSDELAAVRPHHLTHPDLACPLRGPRRRQVHEVDAGDEQNQQRHATEEVDVRGVAVRLVFRFQMRVEMNAPHRLEMKAKLDARSLGKVFFREDRQLRLQLRRLGGWGIRQQDVRIVAVAPPLLVPGARVPRDVGLAIDEHVEREMRVGRNILDDTRHHHLRMGKAFRADDPLPQRIDIAEIRLGSRAGKHDAVRLVERRGRIAPDKREAKDLEKAIIGR